MAGEGAPAGPASAVQGFVGKVMSTAMAPVDALNLGLAKATQGLLEVLPKMPAARLYTDLVFQWGHSHPHPPSFGFPIPSLGPVLASGCMSVLINGFPSARNGDMGLSVWCGGFFPIFEIITGSSHVFIGGARAARQVMDPTLHCLPDPLGGKWGIGKLDVAMAVFSVGMSALNVAAAMEGESAAETKASDAQGTADAAAKAADAAAASVNTATAAAQLAADAAAVAMGLLMGKDPGVGFPLGIITMGSPNVFIGGFPMPGWDLILKGLLKLLRPVLRKIQKKLPPGRLRESMCALTGHPVDVASGRVITSKKDFEIEGRIPIVFERRYDTASTDYDSSLGWGWTHPYDQHLWESKRYNCIVWRDRENRQVRFEKIAIGERDFQPLERVWLERKAEDRYELFDLKDGLRYFFGRPYETDADFTSESNALRLVSILDRNDNAIELTYDRDLLVGIGNGSGNSLSLRYHEFAGKTRLDEIRQLLTNGQDINLMRFGYNDLAELTSATDRTYVPFTYRYENHLLVQETNRNGLSFYFEYDGEGINARCIHTWGDGGIYERWISYAPKARITKVVDGLGGKTHYHYNDLDLVTKIFDANGGMIEFEYGESGETLKRTDQLGRVRTYAYDSQLNCVVLTHEDGASKTAAFNNLGQPLVITDEAGGEWQREYDNRGNLIASINPLGARREYEYGTNGDLKVFRDPLGNEIDFDWTGGGHISSIVRPLGSRTTYRRNERGLLSAVKDEFTGIEITYTYDDAARITRIADTNSRRETIGSRRYEYDDQGNILQHIDARGNRTTYKYSGYDLLAERVNALGFKREFKYDLEERLTEIVNENGDSYLMQRDLLDRVLEETGFDGTRREYKYDRSGEMIYRRDALGRETYYKYDPVGRLVRKLHGDGSNVTFTYDECGRMTGSKNSRSEIGITYDAAWRIIAENQNGRSIETTYDLAGRRIAQTVPQKGTVTFDHDAEGNISKAAFNGHEIRYDRDTNGRLTRRALPNGLEERIAYDASGRLSSEKLTVGGGGREMVARAYEWDPNGNVTAVDDSIRGARYYNYDAIERLNRVERMVAGDGLALPSEPSYGASSDGIAPDKRLWQADAAGDGRNGRTRDVEDLYYDANGNLTERKSRVKGQRKFAYQKGDRLRNVEKTTYLYDVVGNLVEKREADATATLFTYGPENQLISISRDNDRIDFEYDGFGRRILKRSAANTTHFLWDGDVILCENDTRYIYHGFVPVAKFRDDGYEIYHTDHLGTPKELTNQSGEMVWRGTYDEYGALESQLAKSEQNIRFQNQYEDAETGLYYNRFRYYDADGCRYINQDPVYLFGGLNFYAYATNPLLWVDPLGLGKVDGGRHRHTKLDGNEHGTESHHIIANAISDIDKEDAPAIRMEVDDHRKTGSHGHQGNDGKEWRAKQQALVDAGKHDAALQMGIDDVRKKFGNKYDTEIDAMVASLPKKDDGTIDWDKVKKKC